MTWVGSALVCPFDSIDGLWFVAACVGEMIGDVCLQSVPSSVVHGGSFVWACPWMSRGWDLVGQFVVRVELF